MSRTAIVFSLAAAALLFAVDATLAQSPQRGLAAYYEHTSPTANGEYLTHEFTAAHRTLPFGTRVRVTNTHNGRSVIVRINDRGPFTPGRIIDVSKSAAKALDMTSRGVATVQIEVLD